MAIYKPVTRFSRQAAGLLNSAVGNLSNKLANTKLNDVFSTSTTIGNFSNQLVKQGLGVVSTEVSKRIANPLADLSQKLDNKVNQALRKSLKTFGLNAFDNEGIQEYTLKNAGNLSIRQLWEVYKQTNVDELSHKNFYLLEVNDRSGNAPTSNGNRLSQFNLLATSLSFNAFEIGGEGVPLGSVELDKPTENTRTTLTLTMLDDRQGTIKKWAEQKSQLITSSDGTFLPPANYVFDVRIVFSTNLAHSSAYEQIYTMRIQSMQHELSRQDKGLEELQLVFVQADTCIPHWL